MAAEKGNNIERWELLPRIQKSKRFQFDCFDSEEELCDYIDINAINFSVDILNEEYVNHEREWALNRDNDFGGQLIRTDFMFETDSSECVLVECKNPKGSLSKLRNSISQLMGYKVIAEKSGYDVDRLALVTTSYDMLINEVIESFSLPIEVYVMSKDHTLKFMELPNSQ